MDISKQYVDLKTKQDKEHAKVRAIFNEEGKQLNALVLNDKWSIRYQNLITNAVSKNDFINWFKEIDKDIIKKYFNTIPIKYELHNEYSKLIGKIINERQEENIL